MRRTQSPGRQSDSQTTQIEASRDPLERKVQRARRGVAVLKVVNGNEAAAAVDGGVLQRAARDVESRCLDRADRAVAVQTEDAARQRALERAALYEDFPRGLAFNALFVLMVGDRCAV